MYEDVSQYLLENLGYLMLQRRVLYVCPVCVDREMEDVFHMIKMPLRQPPLHAGALVAPIHRHRWSRAPSPSQAVCN